MNVAKQLILKPIKKVNFELASFWSVKMFVFALVLAHLSGTVLRVFSASPLEHAGRAVEQGWLARWITIGCAPILLASRIFELVMYRRFTCPR